MSHTPEETPERPHRRAIEALDRELERLDQARAAHSYDLEKARGQASALSQQVAKIEGALLRIAEEHRKIRASIELLEGKPRDVDESSEVRKVLGIDWAQANADAQALDTRRARAMQVPLPVTPWSVKHGFIRNPTNSTDPHCRWKFGEDARVSGRCNRYPQDDIHKLDKE